MTFRRFVAAVLAAAAGTVVVQALAPAVQDAGAAMDRGSFRYQRSLPDGPAGLVVLPLDAAVLAHSRGAGGNFEDVRILDDSGGQVPYLLEPQAEPLSLEVILERHAGNTPELRVPGGRHRSAYIVRLPYPRLSSATLLLETSARVFTRTVRVGAERPPDRNRRDAWFESIVSKTWTHADQDTPAPPLPLPIGSVREDHLVVVIDEGDNSPLPITASRLLLPSYRLRFFHPGRPLTLAYGRDDLAPPRYDLALVAPEVMGASAREIAAAPAEQSRPEAAAPLVSPRLFWGALGVAVLIIGGIIVRLIRG